MSESVGVGTLVQQMLNSATADLREQVQDLRRRVTDLEAQFDDLDLGQELAEHTEAA